MKRQSLLGFALLAWGLSVPRLWVPDPHVHMYHAEYDDSEGKLLHHFEWSRSPLRAREEQFPSGR